MHALRGDCSVRSAQVRAETDRVHNVRRAVLRVAILGRQARSAQPRQIIPNDRERVQKCWRYIAPHVLIAPETVNQDHRLLATSFNLDAIATKYGVAQTCVSVGFALQNTVTPVRILGGPP